MIFMLPRFVLGLFLSLMLDLNRAFADCSSMCEGERWACSESSDASSCGTQFQICVQDCIRNGGNDNFGAIAFSSTTEVFGYSFDFENRADAESRAVSECIKAGGDSDCEAVVWFNRDCGALASDGAGTYGADWGTTTQEAESKAQSNCQHNTNQPCVIRTSLCAR